ncbi:hypothetical protein AB4140_16815 [Shewanella sp. 10N.286.51.B2]|uniref:hypothetical protein n=1 Tax=Shewanella sp. 10N.286.51.B2 TaxID=3229707 RepID=UPI00354EBD0A
MTKLNSAQPITNIDGTPMISGSQVDINGNPYGVTETTTSLSFDDSSSSCDSSFESSFDSSCDSSFDNHF